MPTIKKVTAVRGLTGFYFDDQAAIKNDAAADGAVYSGLAETEGFDSIRQPGESVLILLILDNGKIACGDCAAVQYSGTGGRDPLFLAEEYIAVIKDKIAPVLIDKEVSNFIELAEIIDQMAINNKRIHTALRYGITQALLDAVAKARGITRTEVVALEYTLDLKPAPVPIFSQTGDKRYDNADKIIIKEADVLPHGLINNVKTKLGQNGEKLLEYIDWLKKRIHKIGSSDYRPDFHIDVYGTIGLAFENNMENMIKYFAKLEQKADPFHLRIEGPLDVGSRHRQLELMHSLRNGLKSKGINVEIVADEWCNTLEDIKDFVDSNAADMVQIKTPDLGGINNTIEAVLYCKENGIGAYQGGSCNETDLSARICTDIALATQPDQILAKPGMGVDEGLMIVYNQMQRTLAKLEAKGYSVDNTV
ncbi:MAG: methylaspartate ammonia-lyase [Halothermotrichaceae bacterium]